MAQFPTAAGLRPVDPVLKGRLIGSYNSLDSYIADKVLPTITGVAKTGTLVTLGQASSYGDIEDDLSRASGGEYHQEKGAQLGSTTWSCKEYGTEVRIDLGDIDDFAEIGNLKWVQSQSALQNLKIWQERRMASMLFSTSNFASTTLVGGDKWSASTSNPVANLITAAKSVANGGQTPNTIILGPDAYYTASTNAALATFASANTDRNFLSIEALQAIFSRICMSDVEVFVAKALYNTANQGQTASGANIWGDMIWLGYLNRESAGTATGGGQNVQMADPSAAVLLVQKDLESFEYDLPSHNSVVVRHSHRVAEKITNAACGYIINDIT